MTLTTAGGFARWGVACRGRRDAAAKQTLPVARCTGDVLCLWVASQRTIGNGVTVSRVAQVLFLLAREDEQYVEDLAFWMGTPDALDEEAAQLVRDAAGVVAGESQDVEVATHLDRVGALEPLTDTVGEEVWGGFKAPTFCAWGAATSNMHCIDSWSGSAKFRGQGQSGYSFSSRTTATRTSGCSCSRTESCATSLLRRILTSETVLGERYLRVCFAR